MADVRYVRSKTGEREIRYWDSTRRVLEQLGYTVAETANSSLKLNGPSDVGYVVSSRAGKLVGPRGFGRWRVSVAAVSPHAIRHNARHNTLLKALNG